MPWMKHAFLFFVQNITNRPQIMTDTFDQVRTAPAELLTGSWRLVHQTNSPKCKLLKKCLWMCPTSSSRFVSISKCFFLFYFLFYSWTFPLIPSNPPPTDTVKESRVTDPFRIGPHQPAGAAPPGSLVQSVGLEAIIIDSFPTTFS